jgi:hypothetical protein
MTHWAHLNIFPDEIIALNQELVHHPELQELLSNHAAGEWETKMAEIAMYCEVIVNGAYLPEEMVLLAKILTEKLISRRKDNRSLIIVQSIH